MGLGGKIAVGRWSHPVFELLRRGRRLRGTLLDPFRWARVRRAERSLPIEYRDALTVALDRLSPTTFETTVAMAELPDVVRGYEELKLERVAVFRERLRSLIGAVNGIEAPTGG
jgi:indolepyruvate ferredoxin oxidoreductase